FNVPNVQVEAFDCLDAGCNNVAAFSGSFPDGKSTTNGRLTIRYPSSLATQYGYAVYYFSKGYVPQEFVATWNSGGDERLFTTSFDITFNKVKSCKATLENLRITNDAKANIPLVVSTSASLAATTRSPFEQADNGVGFVPEAFKDEHYSAETEVTLQIVNLDTGAVVKTEKKKILLFMDEAEDVSFSWTPGKDGNYSASVSSEVTDDQCESSTVMTSSKQFTVLENEPTNQCYTLINNLRTVPFKPRLGEPATVLFSKISNLASDGSLSPVPTKIKYTVTAPSGSVTNGELEVGENPDAIQPKEYSFSWTPSGGEGIYSILVEGIANSPNCVAKQNLGERATLQVFASAEERSTINFYLIDALTGLPVPGATISISGGTPQTRITDDKGFAQFANVQAGDYSYTISHPGYEPLSGTVKVSSSDVFVFLSLTPRTSSGVFSATFLVLDNSTGNPLPNALVVFDGQSKQTDSAGIAVFNNFAPASYAYKINKEGYLEVSGVATIVDQSIFITVRLQKPGVAEKPIGAEEAEFGIHISAVRVPESNILAGDILEVGIALSNSGNKGLDDVKVIVSIPELGIRKSIGPFDLGQGERMSKTVYLELPNALKEKNYWLRLNIYSNEVRRTIHREIEVTSE
ncbi:MAG: carboxypeptidase regulatory-like domain-containing protein, partial [Candidatus Woesearchaeota archaeon]